MPSITRPLIATVTALALVPAAASAAPAFVPSRDFEKAAGQASQPAFDVDSAGEALFAAVGQVDSVKGAIRVDLRKPGGAITRQMLPAAGTDAIVANTPVAADLAHNGRGVVAWTEDGAIFYALRAPGGSFGAPAAMTAPADETSDIVGLSVGIDDAGDVTFAWSRSLGSFPNNSGQIRTLERRATDGAFVASQLLEATGAGEFANSPEVAVSAIGRAVLTYEVGGLGPGTGKFAYRDSAIASFGPRFTADTLNTNLSGVISDAGDTVVAYEQSNVLKLRIRRAADAQPGNAIVIDQSPGAISVPAVGLDGQGVPTIAWSRSDGTKKSLVTCEVTAQGCADGSTKTIVESSNSISPYGLAEAPSGAAVVAWMDYVGFQDYSLHAAARGSDRVFGAAKLLGGTISDHAGVGIDSAGDGMVAWRQDDSNGLRYRLAGFDPNAPRAGAVKIPAKAPVGKQLSYSATASDVWGGLSYTWAFGDATGANGPKASHTYNKRGVRSVVVKIRDRAGNVSSVTRKSVIGDVVAPRFTTKPSATPSKFTRSAGTTFAFALSERANLTIRIVRCVGTGPKPCKQTKVLGRLLRKAGKGEHAITYHGRLGHGKLGRGRYVATFGARDKAGNRSKRPRVRFTVLGA